MHPQQKKKSPAKLLIVAALCVFLLFLAIMSGIGCASLRKNLPNDKKQRFNDLPITPLIAKEKINNSLLAELNAAPADKKFKVLIDFKEQLDLASFRSSLIKKGLNKLARREAVIGALQGLSKRSEAIIMPAIESLMKSGDIEYYAKSSIVNRFYVVANAKAITHLLARNDIARVIGEFSSHGQGTGNQLGNAKQVLVKDGKVQDNWALKLMGADEAWKSGYDGSGIVIGLIDTGVWLDHEQLRDNFRGGTNSWFDPVTGSRIPFDSRGHGTGVISCAAGMNKNDNMIGVAPGVRWIAALANYKNYYNNIFMNSCADWMLTVGKPDIVINAWSHGNISCDAFDLDFINAFKAAEILPIFAAGNQGPREGSSESPADLLTSFPKALPVFAVGSVNSEATISKFSSRGPSRCTGEMFPTIVAPGEEVYFAYPMQSNSYIAYSGTSPACAYAAGAAALAMQKYPEMGVDEIEQLFREHSKDCGTPGPDNQYGYGLIDLTSLLDLP